MRLYDKAKKLIDDLQQIIPVGLRHKLLVDTVDGHLIITENFALDASKGMQLAQLLLKYYSNVTMEDFEASLQSLYDKLGDEGSVEIENIHRLARHLLDATYSEDFGDAAY